MRLPITSVATAARTISRSVTEAVELRCGGEARYRLTVGGVEYRGPAAIAEWSRLFLRGRLERDENGYSCSLGRGIRRRGLRCDGSSLGSNRSAAKKTIGTPVAITIVNSQNEWASVPAPSVWRTANTYTARVQRCIRRQSFDPIHRRT